MKFWTAAESEFKMFFRKVGIAADLHQSPAPLIIGISLNCDDQYPVIVMPRKVQPGGKSG